MQVDPALLPADSIRRLTGFGQNIAADGYVLYPSTMEEIREAFDLAREAGRQVVLRGAARSYGDPSIGSECVVVDTTKNLNRILNWDPATGVVEAEPGVTLADLWRRTLPEGWWLPVVSGTTKTSLGGALAMNIHGKNNWMRGPLGEHVLELDLLAPNGETYRLTPADDLFYAAISGLGLLGAITRARLQMKRVSSGEVKVLAISCRSWAEQFEAFRSHEAQAEYVVSWVDCFAKGASAGRGIVHIANHEETGPNSVTLMVSHQDLPAKMMGFFPKSSVWRILKLLNNRFCMRFVNAAKQFTGRRFEHMKTHRQSLAAYNFLLDYVPDWEKAYLPGGLVQCQYFVPKDQAQSVFAELVRMQQEAGLESFLGVMKRHRPDKFVISHAVDGYSLALDFKITDKNRVALYDLAKRMNERVLQAGGRFYFAKDSTLTADQTARFLGPSLEVFRECKRRLDPENLLTSELAKRVGLVKG